MSRNNVVTWVDVRVLTKFTTQLLIELGEYAARGYEKPSLYGDSNVLIELIQLRIKTDELLDKSNKANGWGKYKT